MKLPGKTACFSRAGLAGLTFEARGGQQEAAELVHFSPGAAVQHPSR